MKNRAIFLIGCQFDNGRNVGIGWVALQIIQID